MRKLIRPKIKDYFSLSNIFQGRDAFFHYEIQNFNKVTAIGLLILTLCAVSFFEVKLLVFPMTLISFLIINYISTYIVARSLFIRRKVISKAKEGDVLEVKYIIKNESSLNLLGFQIEDHFSGTSSNNLNKLIEIKVPKKCKKAISLKIPLNEGFGEHFFESCNLIVSDSLGLFKFIIQTDLKKKILVYPQVQSFVPQNLRNNDETYLSGDFEIHKKGISPNFYGIRHYNFGDPMKFINWKLSGKINELVINEYENAVNLKVNYILNFNKNSHIGKGVNSTWEYSRDLCLALAKMDIEKNHFVEVFSNEFHVEQGSGKKHFELMELKMCYLNPVSDSDENLIAKKIDLIEKGSALVFITPINQGQGLRENIEFLKKHYDHFSDIYIYCIDAFDVSKRIVPKEFKEEIFKYQKYARDYLNSDILPLRNLGIKIFKINVDKPHALIKQFSAYIGDTDVCG